MVAQQPLLRSGVQCCICALFLRRGDAPELIESRDRGNVMPVTGYKRWKLSRVQPLAELAGLGGEQVHGYRSSGGSDGRRSPSGRGERGGARRTRADRAAQRAAGRAPGVQVLFAFLLVVPFSDRFDRLDASDRRVYFAAVLATVASTICLIAPTASPPAVPPASRAAAAGGQRLRHRRPCPLGVRHGRRHLRHHR